MRSILSIILILVTLLPAMGQKQRRVNPVKNPATVTQARNEARRDSLDRSHLVHMHDANGNVVLVDTLTGKEFVDSAAIEAAIPKMKYPLFHSATIGVDFWAPLMKLFNTSYGLVGFSGQINLYNRFIPTVEIGLGKANYTPDDNNYTYKSPTSIYFKIGADYNFLYNSNPDYLCYAGIRYGFTPFKYQLTDVSISNDYWGENQTVNMPEQSATAGYLEFLFGIRVNILKSWSMGWTFRYHRMLHGGNNHEYGNPWYIPGYGTRGSAIGATFSLYYTLPLDKFNKKKPTDKAGEPKPELQ